VRRKLGAKPGEPGRIKTFQGIGYLLDAEPAGVDEPRNSHRDLTPPTYDGHEDQVRYDPGRQTRKAKT
jgi:DNA-binding winged helix-turn-helix (wHTH) protein